MPLSCVRFLFLTFLFPQHYRTNKQKPQTCRAHSAVTPTAAAAGFIVQSVRFRQNSAAEQSALFCVRFKRRAKRDVKRFCVGLARSVWIRHGIAAVKCVVNDGIRSL